MSLIEAITLVAMIFVAGGVSSRLVEWVKGAHWSARAKWLLAVALSAAVGLATAWLAGDVLGLVSAWGSLTAAQVFAFVGAVYATANGFYVLWFKPRASRAWPFRRPNRATMAATRTHVRVRSRTRGERCWVPARGRRGRGVDTGPGGVRDRRSPQPQPGGRLHRARVVPQGPSRHRAEVGDQGWAAGHTRRARPGAH